MTVAITSVTTALRQSAARTRHIPPRFWVGVSLLLLLIASAWLVPIITGVGINAQTRDGLQPPSLQHPFGTDEVGRDIFIRSFYGLQTDLVLVFVAVPVSFLLGTTLGMLRVFANWLGELGQRVIDIILGFPAIILGLAVIAVLGPGFWSLFVAIVIAGIPPFGRLARANLISLESRDFIAAAKAFEVPRWKLILHHYLPNSAGPLLTQFALALIGAVGLSAVMSVIGLGIQPPNTSLGALISAGLRQVYVQLGYVIGPALVFMALVIALNLIADGLADWKAN